VVQGESTVEGGGWLGNLLIALRVAEASLQAAPSLPVRIHARDAATNWTHARLECRKQAAGLLKSSACKGRITGRECTKEMSSLLVAVPPAPG
jgi:hypothetical protein